jgi:hypothetical protein
MSQSDVYVAGVSAGSEQYFEAGWDGPEESDLPPRILDIFK